MTTNGLARNILKFETSLFGTNVSVAAVAATAVVASMCVCGVRARIEICRYMKYRCGQSCRRRERSRPLAYFIAFTTNIYNEYMECVENTEAHRGEICWNEASLLTWNPQLPSRALMYSAVWRMRYGVNVRCCPHENWNTIFPFHLYIANRICWNKRNRQHSRLLHSSRQSGRSDVPYRME